MSRRPVVLRGVPFFLSLALAGPAPIAFGQGLAGPAVDQAELDRLARLSPSDQRKPANQARIQRWFFDQSGDFQDGIRASALGRSALVNAGPPSRPPGGAYSRTFAAPAGRGKFVVLHTDDVTTSSTFEEGSTVEFPRSAPTIPMNGGSPYACWHESLHAVMTGAPLSVRVEDFSTVAALSKNSYRREAQEHVYIELFAEPVAGWVRLLSGFERAAASAEEKLEELKNSGRVVNFEVEQFVWAGARAEWLLAWEKFGKAAIRLPAPIKDEFERASSTRFPTVEEVIGFYMGGDFKGPAGTKVAGKPIKVPKWVMWPGSAAMPVLIEDQERKGPELKAGVWTASFGVRFSEPRYRTHPRVTRGTVAVTLRSDDPSARIEVSYAGRTIPVSSPAAGSSWRRFVVKLGGPGPKAVSTGEEPIRVTVSVKDSVRSASAREPVLPVHLLFRDDPPPNASGKASPSIYLDTEGVFLVKLPAGASSPPAQPGPAASSGGASAALPSPGAAGAHGWALVNQWTYLPKSSASSTSRRWTCTLSDTGWTIDLEDSLRGEGKEWPFRNRLRYSWEMPPAFLEAGKTVRLQLKQECSCTPRNLNAMAMVTVAEYDRSRDPAAGQNAGLYPPFQGDGRFWSLPSNVITTDDGLSANRTVELGFGEGVPGRRLLVTVSVHTNVAVGPNVGQRVEAFAYRQYDWTAGTAAPATAPKGPSKPAAPVPPAPAPPPTAPGTGSIEPQIPPPPPLDKALDETPPEPGELEGSGAGTGTGTGAGGAPPPELTPRPDAVRWYVHPLGDYRIRLDHGWKQVIPGRIDGLDQLENGRGPWLLFPSRERTLTSTPVEQMEKLATKWISESSRASRIPFRVAGEPAIAVGKASRDNDTPITFWHVVITRKDRLYYLSAFTPAATGFDRLPAEVSDLLSTVEYLAGSSTPTPGGPAGKPGNADVAALVKKGVELHEARRFAEAIVPLTRALELDPGSAEACRRRGMSKREQNDLSGALADFSESIRLQPTEPTTWAGRGVTREKAGDPDGAQSDYSRAIELDPGYRNAWSYRAGLRLRRNDYRGAAADFDTALRLDPPADWAAWAHGSRGLAREKLGDLPGARQDYRRALELGSTDEGVRQRLKRIEER
jgi:Flp pilus assembly protein TadD